MTTETKTAAEVGNQHGYLCPNCEKGDELHLLGQHFVMLTPNGLEDSEFDDNTDWETNAPARCSGCGWAGTVNQLKTVEVSD